MFQTVIQWCRQHPVWVAAGLALLLGVGWLLLRPKAHDYEYVAAAVTRGDIETKVTASGKLRAINTIKVGAEVSGQITRVHVDYNSKVEEGQLLAEIDPTRFRARVQDAEAQVSRARASLLEAEAAVTRARVDLVTRQRDYDRKKKLAAEDFLAQAGLEESANQLAAAKAALESASSQVVSARAQIKQSAATLETAQLDLTRTRILAPTSGVVINKLVEPGATVAASFQTPNLFEIASDMSRMKVEASVDEADIAQVREGQEVRFTVDSYADAPFAATVRQIRKGASEVQNVVTYVVIVEVDNSDGRLLPGMTANVEIITARKKAAPRLPAAALRFRPRVADRPAETETAKGDAANGDAAKAMTTVYVPGDDPYKPQARQIKTGLVGEDFVEVLSGLAVGDKVLVNSRSTKAGTADSSDAGDS